MRPDRSLDYWSPRRRARGRQPSAFEGNSASKGSLVVGGDGGTKTQKHERGNTKSDLHKLLLTANYLKLEGVNGSYQGPALAGP